MAQSDNLPSGIKIARITKAAKLVPHIVKLTMRAMAHKAVHGTQTWIKERNTQRITAYYGSLEKYRAIPDWKYTDLSHNSEKAVLIDHGYDEQKPMTEFTIDDMRRAAEFRGGRCLSQTMATGDWDTPLEWQCAEGHRFKASPRLILLGGHWCPDCFPNPYNDVPNPRPWQWDKEAKRNPFLRKYGRRCTMPTKTMCTITIFSMAGTERK